MVINYAVLFLPAVLPAGALLVLLIFGDVVAGMLSSVARVITGYFS
jgi:hypothetical protein